MLIKVKTVKAILSYFSVLKVDRAGGLEFNHNPLRLRKAQRDYFVALPPQVAPVQTD